MNVSTNVCLMISTLLFSATQNLAFQFDTPPPITHYQCVWYGQCGHGWNNGRLNCPATNVTKNPPLLTDPKGLTLLKSLCPDFYVDDTHTRTCCDTAQLQTVADNVGIVREILAGCPACYKNFMNEMCNTVCSVHQSRFMWADYSRVPPDYTTGIPGVTYVVTDLYAQTLFDSCKNVQNEKAISLLCGRAAKDCTPHIWLEFMGDICNGRSAFPIRYVFSNTTWVAPDNTTTLKPMEAKDYACDDPKYGCSPSDCGKQTIPIAPPPTAQTRQEYFTKQFGSGYKAIEIKISRKDNNTKVKHDMPPPSLESVGFTSMYDRHFKQQVRALQIQVSHITAASGHASLPDVCRKQHGHCVTDSALQYWRNNGTEVDKVVYGPYGFYENADYLDHFLSCVSKPNSTNDGTRLNMSCLSEFGGPTLPLIVLEGYDSSNYQNATAFVIMYILNNGPNTAAWQSAVVHFFTTYINPNMNIAVKRIHEGHVTPDMDIVCKRI